MKSLTRSFFTSAALATLLIFGSAAFHQNAFGQATAPAAKKSDKAPAAAVSDRDIIDAKTKGMVWVNTNTKVYHKDGEFYGHTKQGKFMTEDDAKKAGYRMAQEPVAKKKAAPANKK